MLGLASDFGKYTCIQTLLHKLLLLVAMFVMSWYFPTLSKFIFLSWSFSPLKSSHSYRRDESWGKCIFETIGFRIFFDLTSPFFLYTTDKQRTISWLVGIPCYQQSLSHFWTTCQDLGKKTKCSLVFFSRFFWEQKTN